jgi:nitrate reductase NapE component
MKTLDKNKISSIVIILLSLFLFYYNEQLKVQHYDILTSKFFPRIICLILIFLGFLLFFSKDTNVESKQKEKSNHYKNVIFFLVFSFLFFLSIKYIGFLIGCIFYVWIFTFMLGNYQINLKDILKITSFSVISCYIVYTIFQNFLNLMLP